MLGSMLPCSLCCRIGCTDQPTQCLQIGGWFNYVSCLVLVQTRGGGSGMLLAGVLIVRLLPGFFLFPISGVVADR